MSPGDQLITVFIDSIGFLIETLIGAFFSAFLQPILDAIAAALGVGG